jgi:GT2 family glycosyltransferase
MGNVLVRRQVLDELQGPFDPAFGSGGEDVDFFRRAIAAGNRFVWCGEATVYETVPVERTRLSFQVRRALLRGKTSLSNPVGRRLGIVKSLVACCVYTAALPLFLLMGRHLFAKYLVKDFDHIGKLLAVCGIDPIRQKYVQT